MISSDKKGTKQRKVSTFEREDQEWSETERRKKKGKPHVIFDFAEYPLCL
jgi:hypothetical protein